MMTIADRLKEIPLLIEGADAKALSRAINLNKLLADQQFEVVEAGEKLGSNGIIVESKFIS